MTTVSTKEVENGEEIVIARGNKPIARLVAIAGKDHSARPKVGKTLGPRQKIPRDALRPLSSNELEEWGL